MNMAADMAPDTQECPECGEQINYLFFEQEWRQKGKVDSNDTRETEEFEHFRFECPICSNTLTDIKTIGDAQDFFMGIRKE